MACILILLGAPGAGKGTQAARLAQELGLPHISTGDLFRDNLSRGTDVGRVAKEYMEKGELVPDGVVLDMLAARVAREDCRKGYVLDGFPRTRAQAEALAEHLQPEDRLVAVNLEVADDVIVGRAEGRLVCKACGNVQHRQFQPPRVDGRCDRCGGELIRRPDDAPEVVRERLRVYHAQTAALVDYYREQGVLVSVDGTRTPDAVFADLRSQIPEGC